MDRLDYGDICYVSLYDQHALFVSIYIVDNNEIVYNNEIVWKSKVVFSYN